MIDCANGGQEPAYRQKEASGQLYLIDSTPIPGTKSLHNISQIPHNQGNASESQSASGQDRVIGQKTNAAQEDTEISDKVCSIVEIDPVIDHIRNARHDTT